MSARVYRPGQRWQRAATVRLLMVTRRDTVTYLTEASADPIEVSEVRNTTWGVWCEWAREAILRDDTLHWTDDPPPPLDKLNDWLVALP